MIDWELMRHKLYAAITYQPANVVKDRLANQYYRDATKMSIDDILEEFKKNEN